MTIRFSIALILATCWLTACSTLQQVFDVQEPNATVEGVTIKDINFAGMTLLIDMEVSNPNSFALNTTGFDLKLSAQDNLIASLDQSDHGLNIPAGGKTRTEVPIALKFADLYNAVTNLKQLNEFPLNIDAGFRVKLPGLGSIRVPVNYTRIFPVPKLPKISLKSFDVGSISFNSANLTLILDVFNPNSFGLNLNQLEYRITSQDKAISSGAIGVLELSQQQAQQIRIPISVNFRDIGASFYQLLRSSEGVKFGFEGRANLIPSTPLWQPQPLEFKVEDYLSIK